uniref:Sushi domain-containing protein n=1 Tax=Strigops habroptila TaxID=2489341 RepID=A0A672V7M4_STRHB
EAKCQPDGRWVPAVPTCKPVLQCPSPPNIDNGNHNSQDLEIFTAGMVVNYSCDPGYSLLGEASIHCTDSGNWSLPPPQCAVPQIQNGEVSVLKYRYMYKDTVSFKCHKGFTLRGNHTAQCQADKTWDPPVPACEQGKLKCLPPPNIAHGSLSGPAKTFFTPGTSVSYICEAGFSLIGTASIYCTPSGAWSHHPPLCQVVKCLRPPNITNGKLKGNISDTFSYGASVSYSCSPGYSLIGNAFINCTVKGTWSQPPPQCKEIRCVFPEVQGVKKAIRGNSYRSGTNVTLECDDGYTLEGINQIQCQEDFSWDPPVPACKLKGIMIYYDTYENHSYQTPLNEITEQKCSCLR